MLVTNRPTLILTDDWAVEPTSNATNVSAVFRRLAIICGASL